MQSPDYIESQNESRDDSDLSDYEAQKLTEYEELFQKEKARLSDRLLETKIVPETGHLWRIYLDARTGEEYGLIEDNDGEEWDESLYFRHIHKIEAMCEGER